MTILRISDEYRGATFTEENSGKQIHISFTNKEVKMTLDIAGQSTLVFSYEAACQTSSFCLSLLDQQEKECEQCEKAKPIKF